MWSFSLSLSISLPWWISRRVGEDEDVEEFAQVLNVIAQGKIVFCMTGQILEAVPSLVVGDINISVKVSKCGQAAVVHRVRPFRALNEKGLFDVTLGAVA